MTRSLPHAGDMPTLHLAATGPRDAEDVWERYARPALWSTWSLQVRRVEVDVDRLVAGASGRVVGPLGVSADFEVELLGRGGAALDLDGAAARGPAPRRTDPLGAAGARRPLDRGGHAHLAAAERPAAPGRPVRPGGATRPAPPGALRRDSVARRAVAHWIRTSWTLRVAE